MTKPLKALWLHACWLIMTDWSTYQPDMLKVRKWNFYEHVTVHSELAIPTYESEKEAYFFPWQYGARH